MRISRYQNAYLAVRFLALAGFALIVAGSVAFSQGIITGGISGTVADPTGAIIPDATVKVVSNSTGTTFEARSNGEGAFQVADVPIGSYTVTVTAQGFGSTVLNHVAVVAGNSTPLKVSLTIGKNAETVEVQASASQLINTESAQAETVIEADQLATIPVSGAFDNVTLMVPGVAQSHNDGFSNTNGVNYSVNGQRGRSNNSEIDGQTNNDNSIGGPSFFFSNQDALQEVQVVTSEMGAQYGRNMGSVVNYITKQGTNTFHGSGFEYYLGSWGSSLLQTQKDPQDGFCPGGSDAAFAAANGCNLATVPRFVENLYGGTLGGPVLKDKLWLFGSTFWAQEYQAGSFNTSGGGLYPDPNGLKELQAAYPNNPAVGAMVANGPYSISQGNPVAVGTPQMISVTDGNTVNAIEMAAVGRNLDAHVLDQEELGRLDYQMGAKDRFYVRYAYQNNPWLPAWYLYAPAGVATGGISQVNGITHEVGGDWTHTFVPSITNQLRYAFQQSKIGFEGGGLPSCTFANFSSCSSLVELSVGQQGAEFGYGAGSLITPGSLPQGRDVKVNQVQDNMSWTLGRHTFLFGGEFDSQNSPNFGLPNSQGSFNFTPGAANLPFNYPAASLLSGGACSGGSSGPCDNGFTGFLEGIGTLSLALGNTTLAYKESDYALYFQDNWKMMNNLTLNLGLRYEYFGQAVNLLHTLSVKQQTGPNPFWSTALPLSATTYPSVNPDYRNVEPRVGLAFTPPNLPKMVVHAGFAINVDPAFYNIFLNAAQTAPIVNANTFACNGTTVNCLPSSGGLTLGTVQAADGKYLPTGGDPRANPYTLVPTNFRNPMAETYTFGIQYQVAPLAVWEVRYVGSHTFDQFQSLNTNPDIATVQSAFPSYGAGISPCANPTDPTNTTALGRENCNYGLVDTVGNTAFLLYNSMQTSLTVRNFHNITGTASYTLSRAISNTSEIFSTGAGGNTSAFAQDPLNSDMGERGVDGNSYPSLLGIQLTFTEPWFKEQHGLLGRILGGYFLNTFYQYNGGQPFSPSQFFAITSPNVTIPTADSAATMAQVTSNFCDLGFAENFGSQCRPILANKSAPIGMVGINVGNGVYENYATGAVAPRSSFHWLWNNQEEALAMGNPFPGVGRNTLRGDSWNDLDASLGKNFKATERVSVQLTLNVFNVMNRAYYGTPDVSIEDSVPGLFMTNTYTGYNAGTAAGGGAYFAGFGNRNIQLSAHINF
jgi:hypothetical protein